MLLLIQLACLLALAASAPITFDQRQDGEFNVRADVKNVLFFVAVPQKMPFSIDMLDGFLKKTKRNNEPEFQERSDVRVMEAFVEPSEPYRVEINGEEEQRYGGDGRAVEVVIAGRRSPFKNVESQAEPEELKLLGATEQCGPGRVRDPVTLTCEDSPVVADDVNQTLEESYKSSQEPVEAPAPVDIAPSVSSS